ncbi:MAG: hypothetical protein WC863_00480 [Patescibacteria group bacterium]
MSYLELKKWPFLRPGRLFAGLILALLIVIFSCFIYSFGSGSRVTYTRHYSWGLNLIGRAMISDFMPGDNISPSSFWSDLRIKAEPLSFSVKAPKEFRRAIVKVKYGDYLSTDLPIIKLGILRRNSSDFYDFKELQNNLVDRLRFDWNRLEDSEERLVLQSAKNYSSLDTFNRDLRASTLTTCSQPSVACLATVNYPLTINYRLPDYFSFSPISIKQSLRGSHQFYVYLKNEAWRFSFNFGLLADDNYSNPGRSDIIVSLADGDKIIASTKISKESWSATTSNQSLVLRGAGLSPGAYRVKIEADDGIITQEIQSSSPKLAFINQLNLVAASSTRLFTDVTDFLGQARDKSAADIEFNRQKTNLTENYQRIKLGVRSDIKTLELRGSVFLAGRGSWSFTPESFFNPVIPELYSSEQIKDIKYIVADYQSPLGDQDLKTAQVEFNLDAARYENNRYYFLLAIPGLTDQNPADYLEIKEMAVTFFN